MPLLGLCARVPRSAAGEIPQTSTNRDGPNPHPQPLPGCALQHCAIRNTQYRLEMNDAGTLHKPKRAEGDQQPRQDLLQTVNHESVYPSGPVCLRQASGCVSTRSSHRRPSDFRLRDLGTRWSPGQWLQFAIPKCSHCRSLYSSLTSKATSDLLKVSREATSCAHRSPCS
jgi:hypothetical protein